MPLNPSGAISLGGPTVGQSIAVELGLSPTASISLNQTNVRTLAQVPSGTIIMPTNFWGKSNILPTQRAIFGFGMLPNPSGNTNVTNLVSNTGVMATNTPGVGTARSRVSGAGYGGDKALLAYGRTGNQANSALSQINLVSNTGVVSANTPIAGLARVAPAGACYGGDKAIFGYGLVSPPAGGTRNPTTDLFSNTGTFVATVPVAGTPRSEAAGAGYGGDKAVFGFGSTGSVTNIINLVSNTGVVASDSGGVGTNRQTLGAAGYGGDKAIFAYGGGTPPVGGAPYLNSRALVSNTGVLAADIAGAGTARLQLAAASYGGDRAIFGFGFNGAHLSVTNLVSNTGVVAGDTPGVGSARASLGAASFSYT